MAIMTVTGSLAAGASLNVLSGQQFEFAPANCRVSFGLTASAAGMVATVYSGTDLLQQEGPVPATNAYPVNPDQFFLTDVAQKSDRLQVLFRNTTAGALTYYCVVSIVPI